MKKKRNILTMLIFVTIWSIGYVCILIMNDNELFYYRLLGSKDIYLLIRILWIESNMVAEDQVGPE